jgi:hypothetical protein
MKTLSVKQPWAWLLVTGVKDIENRSWYTSYRGPILIHASKKVDHRSLTDHRLSEKIHEAFRSADVKLSDLPRGAIIGKVDLLNCVTHSDSEWFEGEFGFQVCPMEIFKPIERKGRLMIYNEDIPSSDFITEKKFETIAEFLKRERGY